MLIKFNKSYIETASIEAIVPFENTVYLHLRHRENPIPVKECGTQDEAESLVDEYLILIEANEYGVAEE